MKRSLILLALTGALAATPAAPQAAAASSRIVNIGVSSFDKVFKEARQLNNTISDAQTTRKSARQNLNAVLGINPQTSFEDSLKELKSRAKGKVSVVNRGSVPTLQASDAVPSDVSAAIDAANAAISDYASLVVSLAELPAQTSALVKQSRNLSVADLRSEVKIRSISDISTRIGQVKKLRSNLDTMQTMPSRSERLVKNLRGDVDAVTTVFPTRGR